MARLLGARDSVVSLPADQDVIMGRGTHNIPATDKRCSRQSLKVRFDVSKGTVSVTQLGVNPGITNHGTPQEAYMVVNQTYDLSNGQKFTVLMHDYEFTVSIPGSATPAPKPIETPAPAPVKNAAFDWMDEDVPTKPQTTPQISTTSTSASASSINGKPLCTYGAQCRRKNPQHFQEYAHPHLDDKSSSTTSPALTSDSKPLCAYGVNCRRKNPQHFLECAHPHLDAKPVPSEISSSPVPLAGMTSEKSGLEPVKVDGTPSKQEETPKSNEIEENLKTNLHATTAVVKADTSASTSSGTIVAISVGKRPMPAVDLMDDEENFLPKSKKPKAASSTYNKANAMDWMMDDAPISSTPTPTVKKIDSPPPPSAAPVSTPTSSQTKEDVPQATVAPVSSSQGSNKSDSSKKEVDFKKRPVLPSSSMDIDTAKESSSSSLRSCQLSSSKELEDEITKLGWNPVGTVGLLIPSLGRNDAVQESVDCLLETFEHFASKTDLKKSLKLYIWPETPAWAASLRRRLLALPASSGDSTSSTIGEMIEMLPPASSLDSVLPACTQDQLIIVNDSNWRFKGIGTPNSFNVQLNKLYSTPSNPKALGPSLLSDSKAIYPVGAEGAAYPVPVSPSSSLKNEGNSSNLTHIIQLVTPTTSNKESLKSTLMSMFGSVLTLIGK